MLMMMMTTMTMMKITLGDQKVDPAVFSKKGTILQSLQAPKISIFSQDDFGIHTLKLTLNRNLFSLRNKNNHLT